MTIVNIPREERGTITRVSVRGLDFNNGRKLSGTIFYRDGVIEPFDYVMTDALSPYGIEEKVEAGIRKYLHLPDSVEIEIIQHEDVS